MTVKSIKIINGKILKNKKGNLIKYISKKNSFFKDFGEIYFNEIKFKKKKGWNFHKKNTCLIICIVGKVKFHLVDTKNNEAKMNLDSQSGKILKIPPKTWFSFESIKGKSIIANLIDKPHDDKEVTKSKKIKNYKID
tara:strand:- start:894 stop:1304 length:411 start_codon:yes stop_codon:yes gene_type:complete